MSKLRTIISGYSYIGDASVVFLLSTVTCEQIRKYHQWLELHWSKLRLEYSSFGTWTSALEGRRYRHIITNIHDRGKILHVDVTDGIAVSDPSSNSFTFSTTDVIEARFLNVYLKSETIYINRWCQCEVDIHIGSSSAWPPPPTSSC